MSRKKKRTGGHPANRAIDSRQRKHAADTKLIAQFEVWYREHTDWDDADLAAADTVVLLTTLFEVTETLGPGLHLSRPRAEIVEELLDLVMDDDDAIEKVGMIAETLKDYLAFVHETGLWVGSEEDYAECLAVIRSALTRDATPRAILAAALSKVATVDAESRRTAIDRTVPVLAIPLLLDWIGRSRQITASGALRLADIEPAAAMLGVAAIGTRSHTPDLPLVDWDDDEKEDDDDYGDEEPVVYVNTMWQVPEVAAWWQALRVTGVIEITPTTVRPGGRVLEWESPEPARSLSIREEFLGAYLEAVFGHETESRDGTNPFAVPMSFDLLSHLVLATRPDISPDSASVDLIARESEAASLARLLHCHTATTMRRLAQAGLIDIQRTRSGGRRYVFPAGLRPAAASALHGINDALPSDDYSYSGY